MSDKSFGDCPSRNIVKNPLLSTAVTGLSIEDLTHNAVLVPVAATQGLTTRSDHQIETNVQTLRHSEHEFTNFPSGDSNTNVFSPLTTLSAYPPPLDNPQPPQYDKQPETTMSTVSKASVKSDDDFDVNEYFARLQGTRYVSAPINSHPDQNANLAATEENLEEINLNDEKNNEVQQSLTADIAQNFSQLPTVLPHVASAVFSSFSNMLNYKSREQTPDERPPGYQAQDVPFHNPAPGYQGQNEAVDQPLMAEDVVKEVAPPPKEIPNSGSSNFRITTKKKYAQIPGLSSGTNFETSQKIELNPLTKNVKNYFVPSNDDNIFTEAVTTQNNDNRITEQNVPKPQETYNIFHPTGDNNPASDFPPSAFNISREMEPKSFEERLPPPPPSTYEIQGANAPSTAIPPPPMFSTQRIGSGQTGKSVLPPSVARRIGSNQPVIKQQSMQTISTENIFVPTFDPMNYPVGTAQPIGTSFNDIHSPSSYDSQVLTEQPTSQSQDIQAAIPPPAQFTQQLPPGFTPPPSAPPANVIAPPSKAPTRLPPQMLASPPSMMQTNIAAPPMFAATSLSQPPTMFVPSTATVDGSTKSGTESSITNIFSPTSVSQAPGAIQPPIDGPNVGPISFYTPPQPAKDAPTFYNPIVQEQPGQSEPPKPLIEPPKATGAVNYRMNKKRPQYYSGPIEGVGSISNSVKPVIPSVDSGTFQGALFTPEQPKADTNAPSAIPFDLSKPAENVPLIPQYNIGNPVNVQPPAAFDISQPASGYPHFDITHHIQNPEPQYNTAFDLSRSAADNYGQQEELKESKGFGIIGSLKSKLSGIDINKIQHSVTTFFDPAYRDATKEGSAAPITQQNAPYANVPYEAQAAQTNLEIFVPNAQQNTHQYGYVSDYQQQNAMYLNNEYYKYPNFQNQGQPSAGHCSNSNDYPTQSPHPNTYNSNAQQGYPDQNINTTMFQNISTNQPVHATDKSSNKENIYTEGPKTFKENQDFNAERKMDENVARAGPEVARLVQSTTMIEERFANFNLEDLGVQNPIETPIAKFPATYGPVAAQVAQDKTFISESFEQIQHEQEPIAMYNPNDVNLFKNKTDANTGKPAGIFANKNFEDKQNIPSYDVQSTELFAQIKTNNAIIEDIQSKLFPVDKKEDKERFNDEIKTHNLFSSPVIYENKKEVPKDRLLESLTKEDTPVLGVASVPLFGLSTMISEKSKEYIPAELMTSLSDKNSSMSFFDHTQKLEDYGAKHADELSRQPSFSFFENIGGTPSTEGNANDTNIDIVSGKSSASFFENVDVSSQDNTPEHQIKEHGDFNANAPENIDKENQDENASELSICETCREVNKPDEKEDDQDVTDQLIENITSPIQLTNPVETTLTEPTAPVPTSTDQVKIDAGQFEEIVHITEETIDTINIQSTTELIEDVVNDKKNTKYGWTESAIKEDYKVDLNKIAFYESSPRFFKKSIDDEFKKHEEALLKQLNAPSAPPAEEEEDSKSDEAGKLDVHSIEQDANKDFPLFEEFVIEPSKDDDDDDRKSENELDSFTNRVEKYKNMDPADGIDHQSLFYEISQPPISMTSYFDTGNYAVEAHYRNTNTRPAPSIPPGFEEEFKRRVALAKQREEKIRNDMKTVPDTSTQTRTTSVATFCTSRIAPNYSKIQPIVPVGFNIEANITSLVDEQSEPLPDFPTPPILKKAFEKKAEDKEVSQDTKESIIKPEEKKLKLPPIPNVFDPKPIEKETKLPEHSLAPGFKVEEETPLPELLTAFSSKANEKLEVLPPFAAFVASKQDENPVSILPPYVPFVASKAEEDSSSILPPYAPFNVSQPDDLPYSAFSAKDAEENSASILPPYAPFATSIAEEKPASILPPFAPFISPKSEESVLPPFAAFTSSKPDDKSILPPYEPFPASKAEDPATVLPSFTAFTSPKSEEDLATVLPPFAAFTTQKPEQKTDTALPPFAAFTAPKSDENPTTVLPTFGAFTTQASEEKQESKLPPFGLFTTPKSEEKTESSVQPFAALTASKSEEKSAESKLPDPINFFTDTATTDPPETFSRLASYFSTPPKTDHAKSFFELSQSQNHYRHASSEQKTKIDELMKDLTSVKNLTISKDQTIKHVNYFTVEYDCALPEIKESKREAKKETNKVEFADDIGDSDIDSVFRNCGHCAQLLETSHKVRKAVNEDGEQGNMNTINKMESPKSRDQGSVSVNFDGIAIQEEPNEGTAGLTENRSATEYTPVKHHWFYRVDVEDKSIWRGFSVTDSRALEAANLSPDLNENTLVPTDGGRYDVNIVGRLRIPVYWVDKPTNVRRCSWFYKGTTDARYVPYTEAVAEKLEEEYRHGMTTAEWHRRLVLPNGEVVVMHGPSVMVHFLHSDAFSTPPQSSSRPRVVRRGHDESEIEDIEPSSIDHLLLLCHGVGSACDMRFRSVEEVVEDFRSTSLQLVQSHYRNSYDQGVVSRVEVLPVSWHSTLHSGETGVDRRLAQITLDSIPRLRSFTNETVLDVLFYTSPVYCQTILDTVCKELNRIYDLFRQRNPNFTGGVSLGGHSLGSVILYDLLCHQNETASEASPSVSNKNFVPGPAGTGQPFVRYSSLNFAPDAMYALGSPIAIFECIRGVDSLGSSFSLPTCKNFFNIFHPYDPIAYRIEPLINQKLRELKPQLIPHHKGRKRMHLELKDTMARVGADLKQKLLESLRSTWNKWKAAPPTDGQLEKVVEEELEKEQLTDDCKEELAKEIELSTPDMLGCLNGGRRVDYVLQEAPLEMINEYLFAMSSHVGYWESEDTMLLILREIYSALGVQPDSTVPQQNMTVQRTRTVGKDETIIVNATDCPSTSRGAI